MRKVFGPRSLQVEAQASFHVAVDQNGQRATEVHVEGERVEGDERVEADVALSGDLAQRWNIGPLRVERRTVAELKRVQSDRLIRLEVTRGLLVPKLMLMRRRSGRFDGRG